jgi:hypothetical protein
LLTQCYPRQQRRQRRLTRTTTTINADDNDNDNDDKEDHDEDDDADDVGERSSPTHQHPRPSRRSSHLSPISRSSRLSRLSRVCLVFVSRSSRQRARCLDQNRTLCSCFSTSRLVPVRSRLVPHFVHSSHSPSVRVVSSVSSPRPVHHPVRSQPITPRVDNATSIDVRVLNARCTLAWDSPGHPQVVRPASYPHPHPRKTRPVTSDTRGLTRVLP